MRRLPARLVVFCLAIALIAVVLTVVTRLVVPAAPSRWHQLVVIKNLFLPIIELIAYAWLVKFLKRRDATEIALDRRGFRALGLGLTLGALLTATVILILWSSGLATISWGTGGRLLNEIVAPLTTAVVEEILFRAILFRLVEAMVGTTCALLFSATVFGLAHLGNPGATGMAVFILALESGVLLAVAFAASRSLWLPIGLHVAWDFTLGYVFGAPDSGMPDPHNLLRTTFAGSAWLSGSRFGPEGSLVTLLLSLLLSSAFAMAAWRNARWKPFGLRPIGERCLGRTEFGATSFRDIESCVRRFVLAEGRSRREAAGVRF